MTESEKISTDTENTTNTQQNIENNQKNNEQIKETQQPIENNPTNNEQNEENQNISEDAEQITILQNQLNKLQNQLTEERNAKLRYAADIENLRRRSSRDLKIAVERAKSNILTEFLPVIDHLELAIEHADGNTNVDALADGVKMVLNQFNNLLKKFNIVSIDAIGEKFDPNIHEAMAQAESNEYENGIVIKQWQKGYKLEDKLIRPARVVVSKGPGPEQQTQNEQE